MKTKQSQKASFILMTLALAMGALSMTSVFAQDTSAPTVVAPAQPAAAAAAQTTATTGTAAAPQQPSLFGMAMPFVIMLGIMYFLMIRPQQKKMKEHQAMMGALKAGDEVVTNSGILGTVAGMSEKVVTLEVAKNVQLKVLKSQVSQVIKGSINDIQA